jgi:drug/metabolite transporter (DMT)-like permease
MVEQGTNFCSNPEMTRPTAVLVLALTAILEADGDAIVRTALHDPETVTRPMLFTLGGFGAFGLWLDSQCTAARIRKSSWSLRGIFLCDCPESISWLFLKQPPSFRVLMGGLLIVSGGLIIALGKRRVGSSQC